MILICGLQCQSLVGLVCAILASRINVAISLEQRPGRRPGQAASALGASTIRPSMDLTPLSVEKGISQRSAPKDPSKTRLSPPFPGGPCGGTVVTIQPEDTFAVDVNLAGNELLLPPRPISVWLPPGYSQKKQRHPVFYCHDGQNAMSDSDSWTGRSWRMMGALTRWDDHKRTQVKQDGGSDTRPLPVVVLLPSVEGDLLPGMRRRHLEYGDFAVPMAKAHAHFVAKTVKPVVDRLFETDPAPEATFALGSSMGGQASLNLVLEYPDVFGGAACLSPFFSPSTIQRVKAAIANPQQKAQLSRKKIYMDIGGDMQDKTVPLFDLWDHVTEKHAWNPGYFWLDTSLQGPVAGMRELFRDNSIPHCYHEIPGGRHNEMAWSKRIHLPIAYLLED